MTLESLQRRIEQLEGAQEQLRILKVTLDDALKEDEKFQELDAQLRDLNMQKKKIKDEIWGQATFQEAIAKMKDIKEEVTDTSDILNHELLAYRAEHNTDEIIGPDGTPRKMKISVRIQSLHNKQD